MVEPPFVEKIAGSSRSLKKLAEDHTDVIGLVAYGLFKSQQSEWAEAAHPTQEEVTRYHLILQPTQISSLRASAEDKLTDWMQNLMAEYRAEIRTEVEAEIDRHIVDTITKKISDGVRRELALARRHSFLRDIGVAVLA